MTAAARDLFVERGYEGTSIDQLVTMSGVHRGSLYSAFGSKRGLMVHALRADGDPPDLDLLLVALVELAPRDREVRDLCAERLRLIADPATALGAQLLARAHLPEGETS